MDSRPEQKITEINPHAFFSPSPMTTASSTATTTATINTSEEAYKAYEQKVESLLKNINFEKLAALIDDCKKGVEPGKDKDLILLVGRTNAGKSTTLNYLMGCKLKIEKIKGRFCLQVVDEKPFAEIGDGLTNSKTLFPKIVQTVECPQLAYVDLPGIGDTRKFEEKLCSSIAFPMVLHVARSIKGIIIVVDYNEFTTEKAKTFVNLLAILGDLFKKSATFNSSTASNQMFFVFTKVPEGIDIYDILDVTKAIKQELLDKNKNFQDDLNQSIEKLASHLDLKIDRGRVNTEEEKYQLQMKILEIASQQNYERNHEIQNILARCKSLDKELQNLLIELMGLSLILGQADKLDNLFIIRGDEKDDKLRLLKSIAALEQMAPIPKDDFNLQENKHDEWSTLDKIVKDIVVRGDNFLVKQLAFEKEIDTVKKYQKLVENQRVEDEALLQRLKGSTIPNEEFEQLEEKIKASQTALVQYLIANKTQKETNKESFQKKLLELDTTEPMRYEHPNLNPVKFNKNLAKRIGVGISGYVFTAGYQFILMTNSLIAWVTGKAGAGAGMLLQKIGVDISNSTIDEISGFGATVCGVQAIPIFLMLRETLTDFISHEFEYNDLPFIKVEKREDLPLPRYRPVGIYEKLISEGSSYRSVDPFVDVIDNLPPVIGKKIFDFYNEKDFGFELETEVCLPLKGEYKVSYKRRIRSTATVWIELYVEKRFHPDIKTKIDSIKKSLDSLKFTIGDYLDKDLSLLSTEAQEINCLAELNANEENQKNKLMKILEKRLSENEKRLSDLNGIVLGYAQSSRQNFRKFSQEIFHYIAMLKQLTAIIGTSKFGEEFIKNCDEYITKKNDSDFIVNTVWGRKETPHQQPEYEVKEAKISGTAIGASFKPIDKPYSIGWMGKLGFRTLNSSNIPKASAATLWRRGSSLEATLEKIGADLYAYLSEELFFVPKTRLAELPIKNKFTELHDLTGVLFNEINAGRNTPIHEGVYVMSKKVKNYRNLAELNDFMTSLENGKLLEEVMIEGKTVPLKGLMEVLAASRLLADTDVLGGSGKNVGFVIERTPKGEAIAIRIVKVDPGYAFNFDGSENQFYQSNNTLSASSTSTENLMRQDKRNLQYGNLMPAFLWSNLSTSQKDQFILFLQKGLDALRNSSKLKNIIERKEFQKTPNNRELPPVQEALALLAQNLKWQEDAYHAELEELRKYSHPAKQPLSTSFI